MRTDWNLFPQINYLYHIIMKTFAQGVFLK